MAASATKTSDSLTAILFAVFAVACLGAFLTYRGTDVGQLPKLVGNLGGWPFFGPIDSFVGLMIAGCVLSAWSGLGGLIVRWFKVETFHSALSIPLGAAVLSLLWFFLGLAGFYSTILAWIVVFPAAVAGIFARRSSGWSSEQITVRPWFLIAPIIALLLMTAVASLAPPIAKDTLLYHFAVPKAFVAQSSNSFIDGNIASYLPMGSEMHYVWAMLLAGKESPRAIEAAAGAVGFLFFPFLLIAIYGWARELGISRTWALIAMLMVATVPTAFYVASSGYIDLSLALFVTLATYSLTRWWKEQTWNWALLIAIFLGAALSVKLTAVVVIAAFALVILLRASGATGAGKIVASGFAALLLAGVLASPWYIRTWVATGSPVFPFYMSIWPGKANGWDVERSNLFQAMNSQYGGVDEHKLNIVTAPVRASIAAQPERAECYDGVLGVAFLIGLPVLIWGLWKFDLAVEVKIAAGLAVVMYLFWLFSSEQLRYLLPILPLLAIGIAASAEALAKTRAALGKVVRCSLVAASICGMLTSFAWFCQKAPLRVVLGGETRDQYLTRNLDYYPYYAYLNRETSADAKVWLINMRRDTYNLDRPVFSDYLFEDWTLRKMVWESRNLQELRSRTAAMGIKYVLTRHDFLFDYERSSLVDDKKPRVENDAKLRLARDFILDPANTVRADSKFSLIKVL